MKTTRWVSLLIVGAACVAPAVLHAQAWSTDRTLAFQGRLERDGQALAGDYDFRVELWTDPASTNDALHRVWWDELPGIPVSAGAFGLVLGRTAHPLSDAVFQADTLYLAIQVRPKNGGSYVPLSGRQRLHAVPYAARGATAKDLITINLDTRGTGTFVNLTASGATNLSSLGVTGATSLNGATLTAPLVGTGTPREVRVQDDLRVDGKLHAVGGLFGDYVDQPLSSLGSGVWSTNAQTAASDLLVIFYVWADHNGDRCWGEVKLTPPGGDEIIAAAAACHVYTTNDNWIHNNSATVPVPKGYTWKVNVTDTALPNTCAKKVYAVAVAR